MQWFKAEAEAPCAACGLLITPGERMLLKEDEAGTLQHMHLSCAKASLPQGPSSPEPEAPVCKHWRQRGYCLFGDRCVFRHPPECLEALRQQQAQEAALQAALGSTNSTRCRGSMRPGQRRPQPKNKFRASSFRRFLIDTFGREKLREGTGVLDVAGGKGELAFELLNLNATPATVLEPRPLELSKRIKWLQSGFYHWNSAFARYNDRQWISSSMQQARQEQQQQQNTEQAAAAAAAVSAGGVAAPAGPADVLLPSHLKIVVTPALALAACQTPPSSRSGSSCGSLGEPSTPRSSSSGSEGCSEGLLELADQPSSSCQELEVPAELSSGDAGMPAHWCAVFEEAMQQAQHPRWLKAGELHESSSSGAAGAAGAQPAAPPRKAAVAWTISAGSDSEDECWWRGQGSKAAAFAQQGSSATAAAAASDGCQGQAEMQQEQQQEGQHGEPSAVADAAAAWRCLAQCSVVVGMHPDQATEFIVDLALAHGKPFAVVPCCVYSSEFPRRLSCGQQVSTYDQFLQYLVDKDPQRIQVATLPFEGRNKVLYRVV